MYRLSYRLYMKSTLLGILQHISWIPLAAVRLLACLAIALTLLCLVCLAKPTDALN